MYTSAARWPASSARSPPAASPARIVHQDETRRGLPRHPRPGAGARAGRPAQARRRACSTWPGRRRARGSARAHGARPRAASSGSRSAASGSCSTAATTPATASTTSTCTCSAAAGLGWPPGIGGTKDVSQATPPTPEPTEIAGRYQVVKKLGAGAFGTVYKAKDKRLERMVAIKTIRLEGLAASQAGLAEMLERFEREARTAAQLKHPNIVTIYDYVGESARPELHRDGVHRRRRPRQRDRRDGAAAGRARGRPGRAGGRGARLRAPARGASSTATSSRPTSWSSPATG